MKALIPISLFQLIIISSIHLKPSLAADSSSVAINCGHLAAVAYGGRTWVADDGASKFISPRYLNSSSAESAATQDYAPQIPYVTARISRSEFEYSIPVSAAGGSGGGGPLVVRLHFHPAPYSGGFDASAAFFSVAVNARYALLRNFSASLAARSLQQNYFSREFCLRVAPEEDSLNISFTPNRGSLAFINGIEVVSMPPDLYLQGRDISIVNSNSQSMPIDNSTAMETVYRLNVDGQAISPENDAGGMFRGWSDDSDEVSGAAVGGDPYNTRVKIRYTKVPNYTAPEILYKTARSMGSNATVNYNYNLTWNFPVDSGFVYLVRLHFCEIEENITKMNQRVFEIFLYNQTADDQMDVITYAGANGVPIYREFAVIVPADGGGGLKRDLWLALHPAPRSKTEYSDALLNGVEVFKLNRSDGTLAGPNPNLPPPSNPGPPDPALRASKRAKTVKLLPMVVTVAVLGGVMVVSAVFYFFFWRRTLAKDSRSGRTSRWWNPFSASGSEFTKTQDLPWDLCRNFSLDEIRSATDDFSESLVIGAGGFGKVYRGNIDGGDAVVAIKRLNPSSQQGAHEFRTEIEMLSQVRHRHLVSLIGYCEEHREMILVYDHMAHGAFRDYLYASAAHRLPWKRRLEISIGAARGLQYLHTGAKHPIIHRDVKTTNILLDENWVAKVSDFGLSRLGPSLSRTHVSTEVKGSFGYLDPEYYRRQQLTDKSDVYSFGVVLFEVLCGRAPLDKDLAKDEMCLSEWARSHYRVGSLDQIVDPYVKDRIAPECLRVFGEVAYNCLLDHGIERPSMGDVMGSLEFAMQLQESAEAESAATGESSAVDSSGSVVSSHPAVGGGSGGSDGGGWTGDPEMGLSASVFSELISPRGR